MTTEIETYADHEQYLRQLIDSYQLFVKEEQKDGTLLNTNNYLKPLILEELYKCQHQLFKVKENGIEALMTMKIMDQQFA